MSEGLSFENSGNSPDVLANYFESKRELLVGTAHKFTPLFAEDCVQEAILKGINGFKSFEGKTEEQLIAWLRRIVINVCLSKRRLKKNADHPGISKFEKPDSQVSSPSKNLRLAEESDKLNQALSRLIEREREAVICRYMFNLTVQDTAEAMGETIGAVQGLLFRALKKLRPLLDESDFSIMLGK